MIYILQLITIFILAGIFWELWDEHRDRKFLIESLEQDVFKLQKRVIKLEGEKK